MLPNGGWRPGAGDRQGAGGTIRLEISLPPALLADSHVSVIASECGGKAELPARGLNLVV